MNLIPIDIVGGNADQQTVIHLSIAENSCVRDALITAKIEHTREQIGIFGHLVKLGTTLKPNDRIEIYRPLTIDPKEARRIRAKANKHAK